MSKESLAKDRLVDKLSKEIIPCLGNKDLVILTIKDLYDRKIYPPKIISLINLNIGGTPVDCINVCSYRDICEEIKDPQNKLTLEKFCSNIGLNSTTEESEELQQCFPANGTIEAIHDPEKTDYYQAALESKFSKNFCDNKCQFRCHDDRCSIEKGNCNLRDNIKIKRITIKR
jgi:hypothetical protein